MSGPVFIEPSALHQSGTSIRVLCQCMQVHIQHIYIRETSGLHKCPGFYTMMIHSSSYCQVYIKVLKWSRKVVLGGLTRNDGNGRERFSPVIHTATTGCDEHAPGLEMPDELEVQYDQHDAYPLMNTMCQSYVLPLLVNDPPGHQLPMLKVGFHYLLGG